MTGTHVHGEPVTFKITARPSADLSLAAADAAVAAVSRALEGALSHAN